MASRLAMPRDRQGAPCWQRTTKSTALASPAMDAGRWLPPQFTASAASSIRCGEQRASSIASRGVLTWSTSGLGSGLGLGLGSGSGLGLGWGWGFGLGLGGTNKAKPSPLTLTTDPDLNPDPLSLSLSLRLTLTGFEG